MATLGHRATMATACATFLAIGMTSAALGPALPTLAAQTGSELSALGSVFTASFFGSLLSHSAAGPLIDRFGQRPVVLVGMLVMVLGLAGVTVSPSLVLMLACAGLAGVGQGAVDMGLNVLMPELFPGRGAAALNLVNVFFGMGAMVGPAVAGLALRSWSTALPALWLGAALLVGLAPLVSRMANFPAELQSPAERTQGGPLLRSPLLWALGVLILVYVGVETGIGGWAPTYLTATTTLDSAGGALATSAFWMALMLGRLGATFLGTRMAPTTLISIALTGAVAGGGLLMVGVGSVPLTVAAVLLLGLCFGPIYPTTLALTTATFRRAPGTATSVVATLGSVGGMVVPWLLLALLERSSPAASVLLAAGCTVAMLACFGAARAFSGQRPPSRAPVKAPVER
ncbi:MAG: MFS transporter [Roseiflexaceae bacterium]